MRYSRPRSDDVDGRDYESQGHIDLELLNAVLPPAAYDFSCRTGICHTCMSKLIEGEVECATEPLDLPDPGSVLICCSQPKTDIAIDV